MDDLGRKKGDRDQIQEQEYFNGQEKKLKKGLERSEEKEENSDIK